MKVTTTPQLRAGPQFEIGLKMPPPLSSINKAK
jgi:hypothetical protein